MTSFKESMAMPLMEAAPLSALGGNLGERNAIVSEASKCVDCSNGTKKGIW